MECLKGFERCSFKSFNYTTMSPLNQWRFHKSNLFVGVFIAYYISVQLILVMFVACLSLSNIKVILLMAEILHHLGCMKPYKYWDKLPINRCRISAINSRSHTHTWYELVKTVKLSLPSNRNTCSITNSPTLRREKKNPQNCRLHPCSFWTPTTHGKMKVFRPQIYGSWVIKMKEMWFLAGE